MNKTKLIYILSFIAAIFYTAWAFGYVLNPSVASGGTVSELSATSQPYRYFFLTTDLLMLITIIATAFLTFLTVNKTWQKVTILFYVLFGVLTVVTTFVPLSCAQSVESCTASTQSVSHMFAGTFAFVSLLMSLLIVLFYSKINRPIYALLIVFSWVSVAVINTLFVLLGNTGTVIALSQRLFLLLTAIFIVLVPKLLVPRSVSMVRARHK